MGGSAPLTLTLSKCEYLTHFFHWNLFFDTQNTFYLIVKGLKNAFFMPFLWLQMIIRRERPLANRVGWCSLFLAMRCFVTMRRLPIFNNAMFRRWFDKNFAPQCIDTKANCSKKLGEIESWSWERRLGWRGWRTIIWKRPVLLDDHLQEARSPGWSFANSRSLWMIICKRPDPPDDHLQEAGSSGWSFTRGRPLWMIN